MAKVPETLTLVSLMRAVDGSLTTLVVEDEEGFLRIEATRSGATPISIHLTEHQAKMLLARISKFFRDNR